MSDSVANIPRVAQLLRQHPSLRVEVQGHVNFGPTVDEARRLSQDRADAIVHELRELGIAAPRLFAAGFGFDRPR